MLDAVSAALNLFTALFTIITGVIGLNMWVGLPKAAPAAYRRRYAQAVVVALAMGGTALILNVWILLMPIESDKLWFLRWLFWGLAILWAAASIYGLIQRWARP